MATAVAEKKAGSKRFDTIVKAVDRQQRYTVADALALAKEHATAKFDETIEASFRLGIQSKHSIRGTLSYPHSFGKEKRVIVFATGDHASAAQEAGADVVGAEDLVEKIRGGFLDFDVAIATPDQMREVGKLGPILGKRGLMPNPKTGTVTTDIADAVKSFKAGRVEYRADKAGIVNMGVGKASMDVSKLEENFNTLYDEIIRKKPADLKGDYILAASVSSTMGAGLKLDYKKLK